MRETEKFESFRFALVTLHTLLSSVSTETNKPYHPFMVNGVEGSRILILLQ
jgi:hypothetical protein